MRIRKTCCMSLMLGLTLGLVALWAGAAPVLGNGSSVLGGWYTLYWVGCMSADSGLCDPCAGTTVASCTECQNDTNCLNEGYIIVALTSGTGELGFSPGDVCGEQCSAVDATCD